MLPVGMLFSFHATPGVACSLPKITLQHNGSLPKITKDTMLLEKKKSFVELFAALRMVYKDDGKPKVKYGGAGLLHLLQNSPKVCFCGGENKDKVFYRICQRGCLQKKLVIQH